MIIPSDANIFFREEKVTDTVGNWFSILDYAQAKSVSISTIRRGIKSNRLKHKVEDGKYFIFSSNLIINKKSNEEFLMNENKLLRERVKKLSQELDELKMLVDIYEQHNLSELPELPQLT